MMNKGLNEVSSDMLIRFVHNNLSESEMERVELFLQKNDLYADVADGLIALVKDKQFTLMETKQYLQKPIEQFKKEGLRKLIFNLLNKKYNHLKLEIPEFKNIVKTWFAPLPPGEFGVSLMSNTIQVNQPVDDTNFTANIQFELAKAVAENDIYLLNIFESDNNEPIIEKKLNEAEKELLISTDDESLHPGIYYWRLQSVESGAKAEGQFYLHKNLNPFE